MLRKHMWLKVCIVAVGVFILIGGVVFIRASKEQALPNKDVATLTENVGIELPVIILPDQTEDFLNATMIGLIYYNGKIYTQTATEVAAEQAKHLLGKKLGTAKGNIKGWVTQDDNDVEFASTIGQADVYTVNGYDKDFRIMTLAEQDGTIYSTFYECLNGISVRDGGDFFGKFKMTGNIVGAQYQSYSEWYNSMDSSHQIEDMDLINTLVDQLNEAKPYIRQSVETELGDFRNDDSYRRLIIQLSDGTEVSLIVIRDGYINYGFAGVYFKMDSGIFKELWEVLKPPKIGLNYQGS